MVTAAMKLKEAAPWRKDYDKPRQNIKEQRHHFNNKDLYNQSYGFSSSHLQMWKLEHKEGWASKVLMFLNCGVGEDSGESLGKQDQTSQS